MKYDWWYDKRKKDAVFADCYFYPNEGIYRGNIYDKEGKAIGDYSCNDSVKIEKAFPGIFD